MRIRASAIFLLAFFCMVLLCMCCRASADTTDSSTTRKKLFLIERQLSRNSGRASSGNRSDADARSVPDPVEIKNAIVRALGDVDVKSSGEKDKKNPEDATQDFGSVTAKLDGGSLTSFSYSSTGLDLTKGVPDYGLVLLLQDNEIDVSALQEDDSIDSKFAKSNIEKFYGLDEYKDMEDMFKKKAPGKDYTMFGMGMNADLGDYKLGIINYSRPPEKKKKIFFGNDSAGPYQIGATGIVPGSERIKVDGAEQVRGSGYDINYNRGEITFTVPVAMSSRIIVEYELATSGGSSPGKFTGFRFSTQSHEDMKAQSEEQGGGYEAAEPGAASPDAGESSAGAEPVSDDAPRKKKFFSLEKWGVSYFKDEVVAVTTSGNDVKHLLQNHSLMGFDGAFSLGKYADVGLEYAQSQGNKSREMGRFASATFTAADSKATDGSPSGPYYLDETMLPIIENSDEVRADGILLTRDTDYMIDYTYGHLRIKKKDIDLGSLGTITVTYRYLTEDDLRNTAGDSKQDSASKISMKNEFGRFKHSLEVSTFGPDYMQVGGATSNSLENRSESFSLTPIDGLDIMHERGFSSSLRDRDNGLEEQTDRQSTSLSYKSGKLLSLSYKTNSENRGDNAAVPTVADDRTGNDWRIDITPGKKYKFGFSGASKDSESGAQAASKSAQRDDKLTFNFTAKPSKTFSFDTNQTRGKSTTERTGADTQERRQDSESYKVNYQPSKKIKLAYDLSMNSFADETADDAATAAATGTATSAATSTATGSGNRNEKITLNYMPTKKITLAANSTRQNEDSPNGGGRETTQNGYDLRYKIGKESLIQYRINTLVSDRTDYSQDTNTDALIINTRLGWVPNDIDLDFKADRQASSIQSISGTTITNTETSSFGSGISASMEPFGKGKKIRFDWRMKNGDNSTNSASSEDRQQRLAFGLDMPFLGDTTVAFDYSQERRTSTRITRNRDMSLSLNGKIAKIIDMQLSYKTQASDDLTEPSASTESDDLNIVLKGNVEW